MGELLTNETFDHFASQAYINEIVDIAEYWEDLNRIKYIKRLFNRYRQTGDIKINLIVNHLIILFNVFEHRQLQKILFFKFEGYHEYLKAFLLFLNRCPPSIRNYTPKRHTLYTTDIVEDPAIVNMLRLVSSSSRASS